MDSVIETNGFERCDRPDMERDLFRTTEICARCDSCCEIVISSFFFLTDILGRAITPLGKFSKFSNSY